MDPNYTEQEKRRVAIHEAGHAVAAWTMNALCYVRIGRVDECQLCGQWLQLVNDFVTEDYVTNDEAVKDRQFFFAAGAAAETLVFKDYNVHGVSNGTGNDRDQVNEYEGRLLDAQTGNCPDDLNVFDEWVHRAQKRIARYKRPIEAVADGLLKREFLSRKEVENIMEASMF